MSISKLSGFGKLVLESILRTCIKHDNVHMSICPHCIQMLIIS
ncbi:hypothetical protein C5167_049531 [Papaver somniferum]|uniref:Uncharacterized protein n=1 Tax=Papaver somniferum TaxID=3469 RepID=A0A4Y7KPG4_PAPSO|nr:hypothetical protein C5167_049531 [Papaver somniferum]